MTSRAAGIPAWFAFLVCLVLAACAAPERLVILHLNDFHGQVLPRAVHPRPGIVRMMGGHRAVSKFVLAERAAAGADTVVWLTDGGDWFQGTPEGNEDRGWSVMACRNRLGFTAVVVGNHEYDYGEDNLMRLIGRAEHPVLGANVVDRNDRDRMRPYVEPYRILAVGRVRIAVLGLVTSDTKNVSTGPFGAAEFADEVETVRRLLPRIEKESDAVILLTHCGLQKDLELARRFPTIGLILGGHSHTALPKGRREGDTWILQSAGRGTAISRVELEVSQKTRAVRVRDVRLVPLPAAKALSSATDGFLAATFAHIGAKWDVPVGRITGAPDVRARGSNASTPAGNYVADLIRRVAGAQVGLTNKGGIRGKFSAGPITRRQVFEVLPFDNPVFALETTGVHLRTLLALGLRRGRQPLEIAGASYGFRVVAGARQLAWVKVGVEPLVDGRTYRVATNSFLARGGDGFGLFAELSSRRVAPESLCALMLTELRDNGEIRLDAEQRIRLVE